MNNLKKLSIGLGVIFLMGIIISASRVQVTSAEESAEPAEDRIVRVATTTWTGNGTKEQNLNKIYSYLADAALNNPDIVVLSEGIYSIDESGPFHEPVPGPFTQAMSAKAIEHGIYIVANLYEDGLDGHKYNTAVLIDRQGNIAGKYRKLRLPPSETVGAYDMIEGTDPLVIDTEFGKLAMAICYDVDLRFPEVTKMFADQGAELILVPSWGDYTHSSMQFARQNNVFMVTAVRGHQWQDAYPHAAIIANDGTIINGINNNTADKTCYADINLTKKTWSVPDPKWNHVTPPPVRTSIPFASITASHSLTGRAPETLADGYIDNIDAGPLKGLKGWSSNTKEPTLVFDMGSLKKIGSVGVVQYDAFYQQDYFKMYFSQDGTNYYEYTKGLNYATKLLKDYSTGSSVSVKCYTATVAPGYKYVEVNPPLDVRFIKIVGYGNSTSSYRSTNLTEVTAFEPLDPQATSAPFPITPSPTPTLTPTPTPEPTPAYEFSDIPEEHWAKAQIYSLAARKIIAGYDNEDGTYSFHPDANITRAEFIKILTCAFGVYDEGASYGAFTDVKESDWYYSYVASAVKEGLTLGISESEFGSLLEISRQDLVTFVERALVKYKGYVSPAGEQTENSLSLFADKDSVADYAKPALALLTDNKVISGYVEGGNTYFKPENNASRAEVAIIADKSMKLENKPSGTPGPTSTLAPTPTPTPTPFTGFISHGTKITYNASQLTMPNYPTYGTVTGQKDFSEAQQALLYDGIANDSKGCMTCELDTPEYMFTLDKLYDIQSFAIAGYCSDKQDVYFRLLLSEDGVNWKELGSRSLGTAYDMKLAQPVIDDVSQYGAGKPNPRPTIFELDSGDGLFIYGNYNQKTVKTASGVEYEINSFCTPMMIADTLQYGYTNGSTNYFFNYFIEQPVKAKYVKLIGYGNSMEQWYMFSSFTEFEIYGPSVIR